MIKMILKDIYGYIASDPIRILSLVGGAGGLMYWFDRYKNRTRIKVKIINIGLITKTGSDQVVIRIEVENIGTLPNSIDEDIVLSGIIPKCVPGSVGERKLYHYKINTTDRNLPPHKPIIIEAHTTADDMMAFLWFMILKIRTTRGRSKTVFIRSASNSRLSWHKYLYERVIRYGVFNDLNIDDAT